MFIARMRVSFLSLDGSRSRSWWRSHTSGKPYFTKGCVGNGGCRAPAFPYSGRPRHGQRRALPHTS
jgi:hypothetical protein